MDSQVLNWLLTIVETLVSVASTSFVDRLQKHGYSDALIIIACKMIKNLLLLCQLQNTVICGNGAVQPAVQATVFYVYNYFHR